MSINKAAYLGLVAAAAGCAVASTAHAAVQFRDTGDSFSFSSPLGEAAALSDRYIGVLLPELGEFVVVDTVTWDYVTDAGGGTSSDVCTLAGNDYRANAVVAPDLSGGLRFYIACDGGVISTVTVNETEGAESTVSVAHNALSDGTEDISEALIDVAVNPELVQLGFLSSSGMVYMTSLTDTTTAASYLDLQVSDTPSALTFVQQTSGNAVGAVATSTGYVHVGDGSVTPIVSECAFEVNDLIDFGGTLVVAMETGDADVGLAAVDVTLQGCNPTLALEGHVERPQHLTIADGGTTGSDVLYVAGLSTSSGEAAVVGIEISTLTESAVAVSTVETTDDLGAVAALSVEQDIVFHAGAGEGDLGVLSDRPFITAEAVGSVEETTGSDSATPTEVEVTTDAEQSITITFSTDEGGAYNVDLNSSSVLSGSIGAGGTCCEDPIDATSLSEGEHELVVTVEDTAGNIGSKTLYVTLDTAPDMPSEFDVGFGESKVILTWDTPSTSSDIIAYNLIMFAASSTVDRPFDTAGAFLSSGNSDGDTTATFDVTYGGETYSYPSELGGASWPVTLTLDELDVSLKQISYTIEPLYNRGESGAYTIYYAAIQAVDIGGNVGDWTAIKGAAPEAICGATCLAGETGGLCAVAPASEANPWGDRLLAVLLTLMLIGRRRGSASPPQEKPTRRTE